MSSRVGGGPRIQKTPKAPARRTTTPTPKTRGGNVIAPPIPRRRPSGKPPAQISDFPAPPVKPQLF